MRYGADNFFHRLRSVFVCKPLQLSVDEPINQWQEHYRGTIDIKLARQQHKQMVEALEDSGVRCHYLDIVEGATDQKDTRDLGLICGRGAIAGHFAKPIRMGEVAAFIKACVENDIPLLKYGVAFEGGDFFSIDESHCAIGIGRRSDIRAAEMEALLQRRVYALHHVSDHHLDALFNIIAPDLIVARTEAIAEHEFFQGKRVIALSEQDVWNMSANFLLLETNQVLADSGCAEFNQKLRAAGVKVIEVDVSELKKNGGSIRCMTLPIRRD